MAAAGFCALVTVLSVGGVPASAYAADVKGANPSGATAPVADASSLADCPADSLCIFQHRDFLGEFLVTPAGIARSDLRNHRCWDRNFFGRPCDARRKPDGTWSDQMSSWVNNTSLNYCWYFDINFGTGPLSMPAGQSLSFLPSIINDEASSLQPC
jgi:hypothetical protein